MGVGKRGGGKGGYPAKKKKRRRGTGQRAHPAPRPPTLLPSRGSRRPSGTGPAAFFVTVKQVKVGAEKKKSLEKRGIDPRTSRNLEPVRPAIQLLRALIAKRALYHLSYFPSVWPALSADTQLKQGRPRVYWYRIITNIYPKTQ